MDEKKRQTNIHQLHRWEEFRVRREQVMLEYIEMKRVVRSLTQFYKLYCNRIILGIMRNQVKKTVHIRIKKYQLGWGIFKIKSKFKRFMKRLYGNVTQDQVQHLKLAYSLQLQGYITGLIVDPKARLLSDFVVVVRAMAWRSDFRQIICEFCAGVRYIQCKMRAQLMYNKSRKQTLFRHFRKEQDLWWNELSRAPKENKADRLLFR